MDFFWKLSNDFIDIGSRFGVLLGAILVYMYIYLQLVRLNFKEDLPFLVKINIVFLRGLVIAIGLLFAHTFIFIAINGFQRFIWDEWIWDFSMNTYFLLAPEIVLILGLVMTFIISRKQLLNKTK